MIIDKILAQGEYTVGNINDSSYEYYTFTYNTKDGTLIINLQTATADRFPGNSDEQLRNLQEKRNQMMRQLQDELQGMLALQGGESVEPFFSSDAYNRKLKISITALERIVRYANQHRNESEQLGFAINIINFLSILYFHDNHRSHLVKQILEGKVGGLISVIPLANEHQFVISNSIRGTQLEIKDHLTQQLRSALKVGIAMFLRKDPESIQDTENDDGSGTYLHAINLSSADYQTLCSSVGFVAPQVAKDMEAVDHSPGNGDHSPGNGIKDHSNDIGLQKKDTREYSAEARVIIGNLDRTIFNNYRDNPPTHADKTQLIVSMNQIIKEKPLDVDVLSDIYHYLNQPNNKRILNVHENRKYDAVLFKTNTNSWQQAMEGLRNEAMKVLLQSVEIATDSFDAIMRGETKVINNPQAVKEKLEPHLTDKLFCEHRSNKHFLNLFHATKAVQNLRKLIDACDAQIEKENKVRRRGPMLVKVEEY